MSDEPETHALARQVAVLEERMKTMQADLSATLERFESRMADRDTRAAQRDAALADRDTRAAQRDAALAERIATATDRMASSRWWQTAIISGVIAAAAGIVTAIILAALT